MSLPMVSSSLRGCTGSDCSHAENSSGCCSALDHEIPPTVRGAAPTRLPRVEAPPVPTFAEVFGEIRHGPVAPSVPAGEVAPVTLAGGDPQGIGGPTRHGQHGSGRAMSQHGVAVDATPRTFRETGTQP